MLTLQELRKLKPDELNKEFRRATMSLTEAEVALKTNQDKKSHTAQAYKAYRAQILTVQNEKVEEDAERK
ncbi:hypothetical protein COW94_03790 [Candidatus Peregrinibacteria bacterium CG22_combo_CG10-13_8_21_14_all_44_10]|nr:MAG: hypothetical protein AUK45_00935 [Candidatus Peregrinibacteria bacterium CG2_30_44_17]PIP66058.1 MAG: hypothetical protein COW94_03790 [Candidatus Peregrinibacteria bacterium CG22_combo_CG10-13_8_21_14_all_44_10]PIS03626.1 MAG: hypothetical protein COT83_05120 [Candidatus Peregrinibacteria bacterium CG10_big_fil_rev_8_21_14_0_10_44_7]PIX78888.1 MAG: hypothetical protein COZ35_04550 [Candidatus Peregrinibacteria bacterium CG_4_10_14_3_um_filter_44_21]PJB88861.1 MAG: hypothetical protein 